MYRVVIGGEKSKVTDESTSGDEKTNCNCGKTDMVSVSPVMQVMVKDLLFSVASKMQDAHKHRNNRITTFKQGLFTYSPLSFRIYPTPIMV